MAGHHDAEGRRVDAIRYDRIRDAVRHLERERSEIRSTLSRQAEAWRRRRLAVIDAKLEEHARTLEEIEQRLPLAKVLPFPLHRARAARGSAHA